MRSLQFHIGFEERQLRSTCHGTIGAHQQPGKDRFDRSRVDPWASLDALVIAASEFTPG
jgi:hypothetical protein